ncbi:MAG: NUDIX domain-containing protein [Candidatus Nanopelagicales bacterium]
MSAPIQLLLFSAFVRYLILAHLRENGEMDSTTIPYRDSAGKALTDYPQPSVAVDTAVLAVSPEQALCVLLVQRTGRHGHGAWQLPGTFIHPGETLARAALRALADKAGVPGLRPVQLAVLDDPARDDRGWVLSVAHLDVVPWDRVEHLRVAGARGVGHAEASRVGHPASDRTHQAPVGVGPAARPAVRLWTVTDAHDLAFDHDRILALAVERVRLEYRSAPDPRGLLAEPFTLLQLQRIHEAIAGGPLLKDAFRRRMERQLKPTGHVLEGVVGKPAKLFVRRPETTTEQATTADRSQQPRSQVVGNPPAQPP